MNFSEIIKNIHPTISDETVSKLLACATIVKLKRGEMLIERGRRNDNIYFIKDGMLRAFRTNEDKDDILWFAVTGDGLASMHSWHNGEPAVYSIEALYDSELYCITKQDLESLFSQHCKESAEVLQWFCKLMVEELYALERRYDFLSGKDAYERYQSFIKMRSMFTAAKIPLKHIASYLNMTPQTLSKIRAKYFKEKS